MAALLLGLLTAALSQVATAQTLVPHPPIRILIVSDEVNPHGLSPPELTQPNEISAALQTVVGLNLDTAQPDPIREIPTNDLDVVTTLLALGPDAPNGYDVLVYFSHRIPNDGPTNEAEQAEQEAFVAAVEQFLVDGGGVVSFHHGLYEGAGKGSMMSILGAAATGSVVWDSTNGQNLIAVTSHFVSSYAVDYSGTVTYADVANGILQADYPFFNNTPDERYPNQSFEPDAAEVQILLASDYSASEHVLSFTHHRPAWSGIVVAYQPGEHQPTALEPGNNLQILLNAILFSARYRDGELLFGDSFEQGDLALWSVTP